jgi:hypothetical protein
MPNFPFKHWSDEGLRAIRDTLGTYIVVDSSFKSSASYVVAQISVELNL